MICLDTTSIIDLFRGEKNLKSILENIKEQLVTTRINYLEIMFGLDFTDHDHKKEIEYYNEFFRSIKILELDDSSCKISSKIFWNLRKKGKIVEKFDCVIAGILLSKGLNRIITRNVKHFINIQELKLLSY